MSRRGYWLSVTFLLVVSATFRLGELDRLSLYGDEELTAFAARGIAQDGVAELPSSLDYRRALPFTLANAAVVRARGAEQESSYRLVSAVAGALTPAAAFVVAQPLLGGAAALAGGTLIATSEWHVAFSRMARMYAPFLLLYILAGCALWQWATTGSRRYAILGWAAYTVGATLHVIGVFALGFALVPLALGIAVVSPVVLIASSVAGATGAWLFDHVVVLSAYSGLEPAPPFPGSVSAEASAPTLPASVVGIMFGAAIVVALVGMITSGSRGAARNDERSARNTALLFQGLAGIGAIVLAAVGWVGAAATLAVCWLLLHAVESGPEEARPTAVLARRKLWIGVAVAAAVGWTVYRGVTLGWVEGVKEVIRYPYPYTLTLAGQLPFVTLLAAIPVAKVLLGLGKSVRSDSNKTVEQPSVAAGFPIVIILSLAGVGLMTAWGPARYLIHLYPFVLLLAGVGLAHATGFLAEQIKRPEAAVWLAVAIALSGVLGTHGIPDALRASDLSYADTVDPRIHMFERRPDHRGAGLYVRDRLETGDIVVAEDVQQQGWYVGQVDYMLRAEVDIWPFLFTGDDGELRDVYMGAGMLWSHADFDRLFAENPERRVWIITSGETAAERDYFLNDDQRALLDWLDDTGAQVFAGEEGVTRVYCVGCAED